MTGLISVLLGIALLVAGRRLFWLFVAALGFITGLQLASLFPQMSQTTGLLIGLFLGVAFALLAIFLQRIAVGIAGFLAGGFILTTLATRLGMGRDMLPWALYIIGGIIGVILVMVLFDWALIVFSSIAGAALILNSVSLQTTAGGLIFFLLVLTGIIIQGFVVQRVIRRRPRR
ncbi:MAG: hypothetical protein ACM3XO_04975 [Bacteroidota bacterium]